MAIIIPPPRQPYPAVSVIIPLYNAERYISECLDSVLNQTFDNYEVIVVDDCSTDNSVAIVESYAEKFGGRLILSRMDKNSGSGGLPRNKGIMLSRGEYIQFLDADDMLTNTALEEMYTLAKNFDADVVYCEKHYEADANGENARIGSRQSGDFVDKPTFETEQLNERIDSMLKGRFAVSTCFKSVRRKLLIEHENFFPHVCPSEDDIWTYGLLFCAKKFLRVPNAIYIRRWSEGSTMRKERKPWQTINFWMNPVLLGLKSLEKLMSKLEFFNKNPQYRYAVLESFIAGKFACCLQESFKIPPFAVCEAIKNEFGGRLGEQEVLVPALCTYVNTLQRMNAVNVQKFNQFAAQAQKRIAELEAQLKTK